MADVQMKWNEEVGLQIEMWKGFGEEIVSIVSKNKYKLSNLSHCILVYLCYCSLAFSLTSIRIYVITAMCRHY